MNAFDFATLTPILPELVLAVGALVLVLFGAIGGEKSSSLVNALAVLVLVVAGGLLLTQGSGETVVLFHGSFIDDAFARFLKVLTLVGAVVSLIMSFGFLKRAGVERFEFAILVVLSTVGMMIMISTGDLIALYMGFELQSLALYVIAAFNRDSTRSSEAGLKYFVLGALSSGMLVYGCSLVYGYAGTVSFTGIAQSVSTEPSLGLIFGLVFIFAGMAFKVSAVPFHMWTPDVYEGAPTPVTMFFATAPKVAAMAVFLRVAVMAFPHIQTEWRQIVVFVSIASMALGSFGAIGQTNIKRLMAYSSIANVGFMLIGLAAATPEGIQSVLIYLVIYVAMTFGTFAVIMSMRVDGEMLEEISQLSGLAKTKPWMAFVMLVMMFSLAGIPPLAGFFAKFYVFLAAINAHLYTLAVIGVVTSVVGSFYYVRIVKVMYFDEPQVSFDRIPGELKAMLALSGLFVLLFCLYPVSISSAAGLAARSLF